MPIQFACPACKTSHTAEEKEAGTKLPCKNCGQRLQVPHPPRSKTVLGEVVPSTSDSAPRGEPPIMPAPKASRPGPNSPPVDSYFKWRNERSSGFNGEESAQIQTPLSRAQLEEAIESALGRLGRINFYRGGEFEILGGRFKSFATDVAMGGQLSEGRKEYEWRFRLHYSVKPTGACWAIAIVGFLFFFGPLIFLMPYMAKGEVQRAVERAMSELRDEVEGRGGRDR